MRASLSKFVHLSVILLCRCCGFSQTVAEPSRAIDSPTDHVEEYCQMESMKGRCRWKSEVIVMTSARWGRMKTGRCLNIHPNFLAIHGQDRMFLGCYEDVMAIVDKKCSGRSECDIRIPDPDLERVTPCYPDQKSYLETSYTCVKVVQESRSCSVTVTSEQQFISSPSSFAADANSMSSCGSRSHPWRLEVTAGQRILISLLDFTSVDANTQSRDLGDTCRGNYGYILDKSSRKNVSICANTVTSEDAAKPQREREVYTSGASSLDVVLVAKTSTDNYNFLIKLQAVGCANMIPPDNAWLKRSNNDIVIGCYLSQQTWQLKCDGEEWKGQIGVCPDTYSGNEIGTVRKVTETKADSKTLMVIVVIAGGAVIICVTVMFMGIICLRRCKRTYKKTQPASSTTEVTQYLTATSQCHSETPRTQMHS